ncbi:c-type cytochrome biogenesis protein [Cognatishimia sp. MH4019]|uniref:tetratricopeptide repeat protein n=1 Tax=Cognatishimia sp. MH4019 TaxID=2854030 RepID=UPI001CD33C96|nr:tetratricopeptide repeat protein [Cognatishimia sp. MH4019]
MRLTLFAALLAPTFALAVGGDEATPPATNPSVNCTGGMVWDVKTETCVTARESSLSDDQRYEAVRALAYAGRYADAQIVLATMSDQNDDRVLTYLGFTHRKMGNIARGMAYYDQAIAQNPDNLLARSYMGQAHVEAGAMQLARAQLTEIRTRGGRGTWAELSLRMAIDSGTGYSY